MKTWNATIAKQHFAGIIKDSEKEPQIVENRGKPVSVVVSYEKYKKSIQLQEKQSVSDWLAELKTINETESDIPEIIRNDREQPEWE